MNIKKYLVFKNYKNYLKDCLSKKYKISYSQCGEDLIIDYILSTLKIKSPTYLDIGTNHPKICNNTFLFYLKGSKGVCIEPDPEIFKTIKKTRRRDTCLNVGIGPVNKEDADYYVMRSKTLSTFIKNEADKYVSDQNYGKQKIEKVMKIPLITINEVISKYFPKSIDIISLDTEGYDFEIIKSLDLKRYRPKIICVETARYNNDKLEKRKDIVEYFGERGYLVYADTYINSIFIDKNLL